MFNMDEIREKWEELGFLKDLPEHLTNTVIPIVYRIYKEGSSIGEVKNFIMQLDEWFIENRQMISDLNLIYSIDVEYHLCTLFVEHWKSEKRIEPLKWVNKHKL